MAYPSHPSLNIYITLCLLFIISVGIFVFVIRGRSMSDAVSAPTEKIRDWIKIG